MQPYVVLAACSDGEKALAEDGSGVFLGLLAHRMAVDSIFSPLKLKFGTMTPQTLIQRLTWALQRRKPETVSDATVLPRSVHTLLLLAVS